MEEQLISFETAKLAKEKGCDIDTSHNRRIGESMWYYIHNGKLYWYSWFGSFDNMLFAPTQSLLQKWLREVHGLDIQVEAHVITDLDNAIYYIGFYDLLDGLEDEVVWEDYKKTYEEALEVALVECLKSING